MIQRKEHIMKSMQIFILIAVLALFAGCATMTPNELVNARAAYQEAAESQVAQLVPAELHKARVALDLAEESFLDDSDSFETRDLAYVAQRKAQLAQALGVMAADKASQDKANAYFLAKQTDLLKEAKDALAALQAKEDARGTVITLSGSVLFESAQSTLLPSAQAKLNQVGNALAAATKDRNVDIEGHTDSQGSDAYNQDLSERRAEAVRNYLVQGGFDSQRIQSHGMGESNPIANNGSAEGRANNRRVEIIILKNNTTAGK